jgi:hypothetical protein
MGNRPSQSTSGRSWPRDVRELFRSARRNHGNGDRGDFADSGIQQRSNASEGQGHAPGQKPGGNGRKTWRDKLNSCPDLQTAATKGHCQQPNTCIQQDIKPPTQLNYKIYRSYRYRNLVPIYKLYILYHNIILSAENFTHGRNRATSLEIMHSDTEKLSVSIGIF